MVLGIRMDCLKSNLPPDPHKLALPLGRKLKNWGDDAQQLRELMMAGLADPREAAQTVVEKDPKSLTDLSELLELDISNKQLPCGWERCLDLESGDVYVVRSSAANKSRSGFLAQRPPLAHVSSSAGDLLLRKNVSSLFLSRQSKSGSRIEKDLQDQLTKGVEVVKEKKKLNNTQTLPHINSFLDSIRKQEKQWTLKGEAATPRISEEEQTEERISEQAEEGNTLSKILESGLGKRKRGSQGSLTKRGDSNNVDLELKLSSNMQCSHDPTQLLLRPSEKILGKSKWNEIVSTAPKGYDPSSSASINATLKSPSTSSFSPCCNPATSSSTTTFSNSKARLVEDEQPACLTGESEETTDLNMVTAACGRCLMYILVSKGNPTCPKCGSPILLDLSEQTSNRPHGRLLWNT